ncbi:synaptotagmin-16-like [Arapaima gigas]
MDDVAGSRGREQCQRFMKPEVDELVCGFETIQTLSHLSPWLLIKFTPTPTNSSSSFNTPDTQHHGNMQLFTVTCVWVKPQAPVLRNTVSRETDRLVVLSGVSLTDLAVLTPGASYSRTSASLTLSLSLGVHTAFTLGCVTPEAIGFLLAVGIFVVLLAVIFLFINRKLCFSHVGGLPCLEQYSRRRGSRNKGGVHQSLEVEAQ